MTPSWCLPFVPLTLEAGTTASPHGHRSSVALRGRVAHTTPDPSLRCVVLRHEGVAAPHHDLLFETSPGSALASWRVPRWPLAPGDFAVRAADHRPAYLSYEGPISGGRGIVRRVFEDAACRVSLLEDQVEVCFGDGTALRMRLVSADRWVVCQ